MCWRLNADLAEDIGLFLMDLCILHWFLSVKAFAEVRCRLRRGLHVKKERDNDYHQFGALCLVFALLKLSAEVQFQKASAPARLFHAAAGSIAFARRMVIALCEGHQ